MSNVFYREFQQGDLNHIKRLFIELWKIEEFCSDEKILDKVSEAYVNFCIAESTFSKVAIVDEKVVGIIFGSINNHKKIKGSLNKQFKAFIDLISIQLSKSKDKKFIYEYSKVEKAYKELISKRKKMFQGTLVFLALDNSCQGMGIGRQLVNYFKEYMKSQNVKSIYVYTDTSCNFKFYDSQGFILVDSINKTLKTKANVKNLDIFLYKYDF